MLTIRNFFAISVILFSVVLIIVGLYSLYRDIYGEQMNITEKMKLEKIIEIHKAGRATKYNIFQSPSFPTNERIRMLPEWNKTSYLLLAYPYTDILINEINDLYVDIIKKQLIILIF